MRLTSKNLQTWPTLQPGLSLTMSRIARRGAFDLRGAVASYTSTVSALRAADVGGRFALAGRQPLLLETTPGMVVKVCAGAVEATMIFGHPMRRLGAGCRLHADRHGVLILRGEVAEIEIDRAAPEALAA